MAKLNSTLLLSSFLLSFAFVANARSPSPLLPQSPDESLTPSALPMSSFQRCQPRCWPGCHCPWSAGEHFTGSDGLSFHFHGHKDSDFCFVSDSDLYINAHFIGKQGAGNSTWIQAIAVLFGKHRVYVGAKKTAAWDGDNDHLEILFDGEFVQLPKADGAEWKSLHVPELKISRLSAVNTVIIELKGRFKIIANAVPITDQEDPKIRKYGVTNDVDYLAHLNLRFKFDVLTSNVHGVVGQTYRPDFVNEFDMHKRLPLLGGATRDFSTSGLFAADCAVAQFRRGGDEAEELISGNLADIKCVKGIDVPGVVCKK